MSILCFILACWGITQILCYGKIFERIRPTGHFWSCSMCIGFWVGLGISSVMTLPSLTTLPFMDLFLYASMSSATSYALSMVFGDEGINLKKN